MLLTKDLPPGIFVRSFEDRVDLMCAMIEGAKNTPYEGGLFFSILSFQQITTNLLQSSILSALLPMMLKIILLDIID